MNKDIEKIINFFPSLARFFTYLIFLLVPLMFFKYWMSPFVSSKLPTFYIFAVLAFLFIAINLIFSSEYRLTLRQMLPLLPIVFLVISLGVSGFLAPLRDTAFWSTVDRGDGWFFLFHLLLVIITVFILILKDNFGVYKRNIILSTLAAADIVAITVWLGNEGFNWSGKIFSGSQGGGIFGNSSFTATYFLFTVFLSLMVIFSQGIWSKGMRKFALATIILVALSPVFVNFHLWSFSIPLKSIFDSPQILLGSGRGAAASIILGIVVALLFRLIYAQKKLWKIIGIGIVIASFAGYIFVFFSIQKDATPLQTAFKEQAGGNRLIFWNISRSAIAERPFLGWGLENFRVPFHRNFDPVLIRSEGSSEPWTDRAHNIFYDTAVSGGYAGLLLFLIAGASLMWGIYYAGKKKLITAWSAAFLFGAVYAYLLQGLFVFDTIFSYLMLGLLYAFVFGIVQRENNSIPPQKISANHSFYKIIAASALVAGTFASVVFVAIPIARTSSLYGKIIATPLLERTDLWSRISENPAMIRQGADLARLALYTETEYGKKRNEIFSPENEAIRQVFSQDFQIIAGILDKSAEYQKERNNGTVMYMTLNMAARIYNSSILLSGKKDEKSLEKAEYYSRESVREAPMNPQGYWILAQTLILQNKIIEADEMLEKAISIDPYNKQSHSVSIQTAYSVGDKKAAIRRLIRAKQYIPDFSLPFKIL